MVVPEEEPFGGMLLSVFQPLDDLLERARLRFDLDLKLKGT